MRFGLDESVIKKLTRVFEASPKVDKAYIFGSRAKGNYRDNSDIDIAIKGYAIKLDEILQMSVSFDDAGIAYKIDLLDYNEIKEPELVDHIDRVGVELYSRWKEYKVSTVAKIFTGFSFLGDEYEPTGNLKVVRGENVTVGALRWDTEKHWNKSTTGLEKYYLFGNDVVIGMDGSRIGHNRAIIKEEELPLILAQRVACLRVKESFNQQYLWYNILSNRFREYIESIATGTSIPHISQTQIGDFTIQAPPEKEQALISNVLSCIDSKIDLLTRQNKTLEQLAETLFRQWFLEEAEDGWETIELGKLINCINGVSYKSSELNPSAIAMVTLKNFDRNGGVRLDGFKEYTGKYKPQQLVHEGDIVVAHTDITQDAEVIGNPIFIVKDPRYTEMVISMDLVKVISKHDWLSNEFLYTMMKTSDFKQHCLGNSNGSTVLHLSKLAIPSYKFSLPPKNRIEEFTTQTRPILKKKFQNIKNIRTLTQLRDSLLPKLMSGEVRLKMQE